MSLYSSKQLESVGMTYPCVGWSSNFIRRNIWRFHGQLDSDDLWQELVIVFLRVKEKYQDAEAKHLMALFKISVLNRVHSMSKRFVPLEEQPADIGTADTHDEWMQLCEALSFAPTDMQDLVRQLVSDCDSLLRNGKLSESSVRSYFGMHRKRRPLTELRSLLTRQDAYSKSPRAVALNNPDAQASQLGALKMSKSQSKATLTEQLVKAANFTADTGRTDSEILEDLAYELNDLSDADYKRLSKDAIAWFDKAVESLDAGKPLSLPDGFKVWVTGIRKQAESDKPATTKDAQAEKGDTGKRKATGVKGERGSIRAATVFLLNNGSDTKVDDIVAALADDNMTISPWTAKRVIAVTKRTVRSMLEAGWPNEKQAKEFAGV